MKEVKVKTAILSIEYKDMDKIVLTNTNGDTYTSKSEELKDFLYNCDDQPHITKLDIENKALIQVLEQVTEQTNLERKKLQARNKELENSCKIMHSALRKISDHGVNIYYMEGARSVIKYMQNLAAKSAEQALNLKA